MKRGIALVLALLMIIVGNGTTLNASDVLSETEQSQETISIEDSAGNNQESVSGEAEAQDEVLSTDEDSALGQAGEDVESKINSTAEEESSVTDTEEVIPENIAEQDAVAFIYLDEAVVSNSQEQNVVVSFENQELSISNLKLFYNNLNDGREYEAVASRIEGGSVLIPLKIDESITPGQYRLERIEYDSVNGPKEIQFTDDYLFEVVEGNDAVDIEDVSTYTIDENEQLVEGSSEGIDNLSATITDTLEESDFEVTNNLTEQDKVKETRTGATTAARSNFVVAICAGHDDNHAGAAANGLNEEKLTLKVAQYCRDELSAYPGITVVMIRDSGTCPINPSGSVNDCLRGRVDRAKAAGADLFIDLHFNSASAGAYGAEIWYPNDHWKAEIGQKGEELASAIIVELEKLGLYNRGIKIKNTVNDKYVDGSTQDWYFTNRYCKEQDITGIIIEHAFLTNSGDASKLQNESFIQSLGIADATGIANYLGQFKIDYSPVFDFEYYLDRYPEVAEVYGYSEEAALQHFINFGMSEGRRGNEEFNVKSYKNRYPDLRLTFEDDLPSYYIHYITNGKSEGRIATGDVELVPITVYNGIDYSPVYNFEYYVSRYSDVKNEYSDNDAGAIKHFVNSGMREGRVGCEDFSPRVYKNKYSDVRSAFGDDWKQYYLHYLYQGMNEKRTANINEDLEPSDPEPGDQPDLDKVTVYNGVDYSAVYNYDYYLEHNSDVKKVYGDDPEKVLQHFVEFGMSEGRQGSSGFNVTSYRNRYQDLRISFEKDIKAYYLHYISSGQKEGRKATGKIEMVPITVYNGVDYSAVYDFYFYIDRYSDLQGECEDNDVAAIKHFVNFGMAEGRQASADFSVKVYKNRYPDLRTALGGDLKAYYLHYLSNGIGEGRTATGSADLVGYVTVYKGINYANVYDFNYYIDHNSDIRKLYGNDDVKALEHFVQFGMNEGRQGCEEFNVKAYYNNYADLRKSYGSNYALYYLHYINWGKAEGRNAKTFVYTMIMGNSNVSIDQMVKYYKSKADYPAFYAKSDAPTLESFCQIYLEECAREGVKTEVAFSQAMKETAFLKYGGDVKIEQYNFAGLGATGGGAPGNSFPSVRIGIRAQVQHLKAYASEESLNSECVDPRYQYVDKGCAPYVEWLGIQENPEHKGWATSPGYGYSIINDYMKAMLAI